MDTNPDLKFYRERWKAVEEIDRIGLVKYNFFSRFMVGMGIKPDKDVDNMQVILRWAKLKQLYEQEKSKNMN